jgi:hypothetical protein
VCGTPSQLEEASAGTGWTEGGLSSVAASADGANSRWPTSEGGNGIGWLGHSERWLEEEMVHEE